MIEEKGYYPPANKIQQPEQNKAELVRVKFKPGRAVEGLGGPGEIVEVTPQEAERLREIGYADRIDEE